MLYEAVLLAEVLCVVLELFVRVAAAEASG